MVEQFKESVGFDEHVSVLNHVSLSTREFYDVILKSAKGSLYKIGINALNGVVDLNQRVRLSDSDEELKGTERIRVGMLGFAANPLTVAHTIIAMLKSMADNELDVFFATVTKGDYRKPALKATFPVRQAVAEELIGHIFAGLIKVAPPLKIMNKNGDLEDDPGINAEEKVKEYARLNKKARSFFLAYLAGEDHYRSVLPKFERITDENIKDFRFYVEMPGYKDLLLHFWDLNSRSIPGNYKSFFDQLREGRDPVDLLEVGAFFPVLDTDAKLYLEQDYFKREAAKGSFSKSTQIAHIMIGRAGESSVDTLRDRITKVVSVNGVDVGKLLPEESNKVEVFINTGIPHEVSATILRNGIDHLIERREFDLDLLMAMHREVLQMAMGQYVRKDGTSISVSGPLLFATWLRTASVGLSDGQKPVFPRSIESMIPSLRKDLTAYRSKARNTLIFNVHTILRPKYETINVDEFEENRRTVIIVRAHLLGDPEQQLTKIMTIRQGWIAYYDAEGNNVSKRIDVPPEFDPKLDPVLREQLANVALRFYLTLNDYSPVMAKIGYEVKSGESTANAAMVSPKKMPAIVSSAMNPGGIDFNADQMRLNLQKSGAGVLIHFDPSMIARFQNDDFKGFVPIIIDIGSISNIGIILGLDRNSLTQRI